MSSVKLGVYCDFLGPGEINIVVVDVLFGARDPDKEGVPCGIFLVAGYLLECVVEFASGAEELLDPGVSFSVEGILGGGLDELVEGVAVVASDLVVPALGEDYVCQEGASAEGGELEVYDCLLVGHGAIIPLFYKVVKQLACIALM